jgi:Siphovirus Gp157
MAESMTMTNLYILTANQHELIAKLEAADFDAQTITDTLEGEENSLQLQEKRLGYVAIIKQKQALAAMRKAAAADIMALADKDANAAQSLSDALFASMQATGDKDLIGVEFEAHIQGKPAAVVIADPTLIPAEYWYVPEPKVYDRAVNKTQLSADLKAGKVIAGASLGINKKLVIK